VAPTCIPPVADAAVVVALVALLAPRLSPDGYTAGHVPWWTLDVVVVVADVVAVARVLVIWSNPDAVEAQR
jgi:hypothetical protein